MQSRIHRETSVPRRVTVAVLIGAALAVTALAAGCSGAGGPSGNPSIRGLVSTAPTPQSGHLDASQTSFMVIGTKQPDTQYISAQVTVNSKTKVWRRTGTTLQATDVKAIRRGQRIEAWFEGPVAESEPVQATAGSVVIIAE